MVDPFEGNLCGNLSGEQYSKFASIIKRMIERTVRTLLMLSIKSF